MVFADYFRTKIFVKKLYCTETFSNIAKIFDILLDSYFDFGLDPLFLLFSS